MAILTVVELRKHLPDFPTGTDNDAVLTRLLAASEEAINKVASTAAVTEFLDGGYADLILSRPASAFTSVKEDFDGTVVTLAVDDYRSLAGGTILYRLNTGTNTRSTWHGKVQVVYTPAADTSTREAVQVLLVSQFLNFHPGLTSETVGDWAQTFASNSVYNWALERENILATLVPRGRMAVIG